MNILLFTLGLYFITAVLAQNPYSLTTADLDGNGLADIIVGAPYFTGRKSNQRTWNATDVLQNTAGSPTGDSDTPTSGPRRPETSWGQLNPDIGRVYIFYGIPSNTSDRIDSSAGRDRPDYTSRPPVVLTGPKAVGGRFGHALVNLGDLDGDGTEDLAVSCPYCTPPKGSEEKGAVLIYLGQHHVLLKDEPFEVIWPSRLPRDNVRATCGDFGFEKVPARAYGAFGWSLSGGIDLDGNYAPDLVVGDFESNQVGVKRK